MPATVARHRGNDRDRTLALCFEARRERCQQGGYRDGVVGQLAYCQVRGSLAGFLVAQRAVGDEYRIEAAEQGLGPIQHRLVSGEVIRVQHLRADLRGAPDLQVHGHRLQDLRLAAHQEQGIAACGEDARGGRGNRGSRAHNQYSSQTPSVTRRQNVDEQRGSRNCCNSRQRG